MNAESQEKTLESRSLLLEVIAKRLEFDPKMSLEDRSVIYRFSATARNSG